MEQIGDWGHKKIGQLSITFPKAGGALVTWGDSMCTFLHGYFHAPLERAWVTHTSMCVLEQQTPQG